MRSHALYFPALMVAALNAALVPYSLLNASLRAGLVHPMTLVAAGVTVVLFLWMLLDPRCRRGIGAANVELLSGRSWPSMRWVVFTNPEWGLFGSRTGAKPLLIFRAVLLIEFIVAQLLTSKGNPDLLLLSAASFSVTMMLSIIHVGLNTEAPGI